MKRIKRDSLVSREKPKLKLNSVNAMCISIMLLLSSLMLVMGASSAHAQATNSTEYFAVYYQAPTSSGSSYVTIGGQTIKIGQSNGATFCYIPDLNTTTLVPGSQYYSPSYSPNGIIPYTVDNRLFLIYEQLPQGGSNEQLFGSLTEVNPANGATLITIAGYDFYQPSSFAVVDKSLYFVSGYSWNAFRLDYEGGQLCVVNLTSNGGTLSEKQLLTSSDPNNNGTLVSAGGNLFRYQFADGNLTIDQIDLGTGKIAKGAQLFMPASPQPSTNATYSDWSFSADENTFYIAAVYTPGSNATSPLIHLRTIPLKEFENNSIPNGPDNASGPEYWFNVNGVGFTSKRDRRQAERY